MVSEKYIFKSASLKILFKLLTQKKHFQSDYIKKDIFKFTLSIKCNFKIGFPKDIFLKLLPQKIHFQNCSLKKYFFEKYILKTTPLKNTFSKNAFSKYTFSKNTFSKLLPQKIRFQSYSLKKPFSNLFSEKNSFLRLHSKKCSFKKIHSQNCSLKKYFFKKQKHLQKVYFEKNIFKIDFSKNINLIALIYSSSYSSDLSVEEISLKSSCISRTTFFSIYLHSFKKTCG